MSATSTYRRWAVAIAALLFVAVTAVRLTLTSVADAYSLLYVLPIVLVALAHGCAGGLAAAALAMALVGVWTQLDDVALSFAGYLTRAIAFFVLGGVVGHETDRLRRVCAEQEKLLARVEAIARTDDLTGLLNRRAWDEELRREMHRARRNRGWFAVALLDLDRFKAFNDRYGHHGGDDLLRQAAHNWRRAVRVVDTMARYGGEEFAVLLPACPAERALDVIERLRRATPMSQTLSAGIAIWDGDESGDNLMGRADGALYQAKRAGRDRVIVAPAR